MNKNIAYVSITEWNRKVMRWIWISIGLVVFIQILLFLFYQPVPECSKREYLDIFVIRPSIMIVMYAGSMELIFRFFGEALGEYMTTILFLLIQFLILGTVAAVHSSVPYMCMILTYPVIFANVYREKIFRYAAFVICILVYAGITYGFIPSTEFRPDNSREVYLVIFVGFTIVAFSFSKVLTSVVVNFEKENRKIYEENQKVHEENQKIHEEKEKILEISQRDSMTGLYNHKMFYDKLNEQLQLCSEEYHLSLVIIDIDNFKRINDTFGHAVGDNVILKIVSVIEKNVDDKDVAARYGGEEFGLILAGKTEMEAYNVSERIRREVEAAKVEGVTGRITISLGMLEVKPGDKNGILLFKEVDSALYEAKQTGKNKTVCRGWRKGDNNEYSYQNFSSSQ
ncbi:MAG: GGDEF domain-containing protein [Lachnospiraceae bacterium]|nr:GGDEF domain-containing protein [Lachnospiraceae bacterium]